MAENPFLGSDKSQQLAMLLMSLGGGMSAAGAAGRPFYEGFAPAAGMFSQGMAQSQQSAQQRQDREEAAALRKRALGLQESEIGFKRQEREDANRRRAGMSSSILQALGVPGMGVPPTQPTMGPGTYAPQQAGFDMLGYLTKEKGLSPVQAAAAVGNFQQESGFNPAASHDGGTGHGIGGWRLDRRDALQRYAQQRGGDINDPKLQADFFVDEIKTRPEYTQFSQAQTPQDASTALMHYFRPAGYTPNNPQAGHGFTNRVGYANAYAGGPQISQGDTSPTGGGMQDLDPQIKAVIAATAQHDPEKAAAMLVQARSALAKTGAKTDAWYPLSSDDAKMFLGPAYDPNKPLQRNRVTGEIKQVGSGPLVNIDNKQQGEFAKTVGKNDAERLKAIQDAEGTMSDMASKIGFAVQQLGDTYTGTGAEGANAFFKALGSFGFEEAGKKANAASAAHAIISQMKPHMRAAGSGSSSDRDMDMFAAALPSLVNLPDGNQRIAAYFQRLADRATQIRQLAEEYSEGGTRPLTGTKFADEVKKIGPLFSEEERKELLGVGKAKAQEPPPPPSGFKIITPGGMSPMPNLPPPPAGFRMMSP